MGNVLVLGSGGREHALAWKIKQSPDVENVYIAPGNAGTALAGQNINLAVTDFASIEKFVVEKNVDLTVVGPEAPLAAGIVNYFIEHALPEKGFRIFGPTKEACIERSKALQKDIMLANNIPTAEGIATTADGARDYILDRWKADRQFVVKLDGLCGGKGVIVPNSIDEALLGIEKLKKDFPKETTFVVEQKLTGPEVSITALCDGDTVKLLMPSQDHKRVYNDDQGPNTGGMGAYAPTPYNNAVVLHEAETSIIKPLVRALQKAGTPYHGVIYAGLMISGNQLKVLEFNSRFGDPETQVTLPLVKGNLYQILKACTEGTLDKVPVENSDGAACCVVMTAKGYPDAYPKGEPINGLEETAELGDVVVFHAGTAKKDGVYVTNGGRVLGVTGLASTIEKAIGRAYVGASYIRWQNEHHRTDIGKRALGA